MSKISKVKNLMVAFRRVLTAGAIKMRLLTADVAVQGVVRQKSGSLVLRGSSGMRLVVPANAVISASSSGTMAFVVVNGNPQVKFQMVDKQSAEAFCEAIIAASEVSPPSKWRWLAYAAISLVAWNVMAARMGATPNPQPALDAALIQETGPQPEVDIRQMMQSVPPMNEGIEPSPGCEDNVMPEIVGLTPALDESAPVVPVVVAPASSAAK